MTKATVLKKKTRANARSVPRVARAKAAGAMPEIGVPVHPRTVEMTPAELAASLTDYQQARRLLAVQPEPLEIGREDHATLSDVVYAALANEMSLEVGLLRNLAMAANGLVQAVLAGSGWMTEDEFRQYVYAVARDIRDRARAGARVIEMRNNAQTEGGAS